MLSVEPVIWMGKIGRTWDSGKLGGGEGPYKPWGLAGTRKKETKKPREHIQRFGKNEKKKPGEKRT